MIPKYLREILGFFGIHYMLVRGQTPSLPLLLYLGLHLGLHLLHLLHSLGGLGTMVFFLKVVTLCSAPILLLEEARTEEDDGDRAQRSSD